MSSIIAEKNCVIIFFFKINSAVEIGIFESPDIFYRVPVLFPAFYFLGSYPAIIGLVVRVGAYHYFHIRSIVFR
jgi:hypothetical protein